MDYIGGQARGSLHLVGFILNMQRIEELQSLLTQTRAGLLYAQQQIAATAKLKLDARLYDLVAKIQAHFEAFLASSLNSYFRQTAESISEVHSGLQQLRNSMDCSPCASPK